MDFMDPRCIERAAGLVSSHYKSRIPVSELDEECLRDIAKISTPSTLDPQDLFIMLSTEDVYKMDGASRQRVLEALDFPPSDPEGVHLTFKAVPTKRGKVALTIITPERNDPSKTQVLFVGGLNHKTALYLSSLVSLAKSRGTVVYAMDIPGVGASRLEKGLKADHETLYDALLKTIESIGVDRLVVMGHSLGSVPVRHLYLNQSDTRTEIERFVLIAPVPGEEESKAGLELYNGFQWCMISKLLGGSLETCRDDLFFQDHPEAEREWLSGIVAKERYPAGLGTFLDIISKVSDDRILDKIGRDERLILVLAGDDRLMRLADPDAWRGKGVYIIPGADHSFLGGKGYAARFGETLAEVLDGRWDGRGDSTPPLDKAIERCTTGASFALSGEAVGRGGRGMADLRIWFQKGLGGPLQFKGGVDTLFGGGNKGLVTREGAFLGLMTYMGNASRVFFGLEEELGFEIPASMGYFSSEASLGYDMKIVRLMLTVGIEGYLRRNSWYPKGGIRIEVPLSF
jgi:pimeloyl-ACP methyl ester carboxylesterase